MVPLVGIVIPCYNYGKYLEEAVNSVLISTYENFEIVIVDDGSTDPYTLKTLEKIVKINKIRVVTRTNGGLSAARNTGISSTNAKYILTLDADDKIDETFIEKAVWILENKPDYSYIFSLVQLFGEVSKMWRTFEAPLQYLKFRNVVPATIVMRKQCWEQVGGYDESMRDGYEDWEFILRLGKANFSGYHINEPLFYYRKHKGSMLEGSKKKNKILKNTIRKKHKDIYRFITIQFIVFLFLELQRRKMIYSSLVKRSLYEVSPFFIKECIKKVIFKDKNKIFKMDLQIKKVTPPSSISISITRKTILILLPWLHVGGVETVFYQIVKSLYNKYDFIIATTKSSEGHPWVNLFQPFVKRIYHLDSFLKTNNDRYLFLKTLIESYDVSAIHISNSQFGYNILPFIKRDFPNINIFDTLHMEEPWSKWDYFDFSVHYSEYIGKTVVLTESQAQTLVEKCPQKKGKIVKISNGFEISIGNRYQKNNVFTVVFIARLAKQKQPLIFLKIAKRFKSKFKDVPIQFHMYGDGELRRKVGFYINLWGLRSVVKLFPFTNQVQKVLTESHVLLMPSMREGLPMIGLEAMNSGTVVVASNVAGWNDLIIHEETGILCNNMEDYVIQLDHLMRNTELYDRIIGKAMISLENEFSLDRMIGQYSHLYSSLGER
ncbi:glycosyltransferase [Paenibacillus rigui]|nr:glycosyltransferase [Paenibacillus rigui]